MVRGGILRGTESERGNLTRDKKQERKISERSQMRGGRDNIFKHTVRQNGQNEGKWVRMSTDFARIRWTKGFVSMKYRSMTSRLQLKCNIALLSQEHSKISLN